MNRNVIPEYYPDKCIGCETLGAAIMAREEAVGSMGLLPSRKQINTAHRVGNVARKLCETAAEKCQGIAEGCMFEVNNDKES